MKAEAQENKALQVASLAVVPIDLKPDFGPVRIPDFKELISKLQAQIAQADRPQRRTYEPVLETRNSKLETYSNLSLALLNPKSKI